MITEMRLQHRVIRPVPDAAPTPVVWAAAFFGSFLMLPLLGAVGVIHDPATALVIFSVFAGVLSLGAPARAMAAPGTAAVCWLFLDGFVVNLKGDLTWSGADDMVRLGVLLGAALLGTAIARLLTARTAYRRLSSRHV
ncbi:hypothetical protein [Streptomyces sp. NPDC048639]|uniref:hypothetical protein n=1 Tax=Streptomyces sp. NPDC048639 TaxID=3365581 RepID=UPI003722AB66